MYFKCQSSVNIVDQGSIPSHIKFTDLDLLLWKKGIAEEK